MSRIGPENWRTAFITDLIRRSGDEASDFFNLLDDARYPGTGTRVFSSDGDGTVSMWVPAEDRTQVPTTLVVASAANPTDRLASVELCEIVEDEELGLLGRYELDPLAWARKIKDADAGILLRGEGPKVTYAPLCIPDQWFAEDLRLLTGLAKTAGTEFRPEPYAGGLWIELDSTQRETLERVTGRPAPSVVHRNTLEALVSEADEETGSLTAGIESLANLIMGDDRESSVAPSTESVKHQMGEALSKAAPTFDKVLGAGWNISGNFTAELCSLAQAASEKPSDKKIFVDLLAGREVDDALAEAALDETFGYGFSTSRQPTSLLVDAIIDEATDDLSLEEIADIRAVREQYKLNDEVEIYGTVLSTPRVQTTSADQKLKEITTFLSNGTQLPRGLVLQVAQLVLSAVNTPSEKPNVIVLTGDVGTSADTLFRRMQQLFESPIVEIQSAVDLRGNDPVGVLVGSPNDRPGIAKSLLTQRLTPNERPIFSITGTDQVGTEVAPKARNEASRQLWNFIATSRREGKFRAYSPGQPPREIDLGHSERAGEGVAKQAVFLVRDGRPLEELKDSMDSRVWEQLAPMVVDLGVLSLQTVVAEIQATLSEQIQESFGLKDANVELAPEVVSFIGAMIAAGVPAERTKNMVTYVLNSRLFFAGVDDALAPHVRINMASDLTTKELAKIIEAWKQGEFHSIAGRGTCPFDIHNLEFSSARQMLADAKLKKANASNDKIEQLMTLLARYQLSADKDGKQLAALVSQLGNARVEISDLGWRNQTLLAYAENLEAVNQLAAKAIRELEEQVATANAKIEKLNKRLSVAKTKTEEIKALLDLAVQERDDIVGMVRAVESEFDAAIHLMNSATEKNGEASLRLLQRAEAMALGSEGNRFVLMAAKLAFCTGAEAMIDEAAGYSSKLHKFSEISNLAQAYAKAARALGEPIDDDLLGGLAMMAVLSGDRGATDSESAKRFKELTGFEAEQSIYNPGYQDSDGAVKQKFLNQNMSKIKEKLRMHARDQLGIRV